MKIDHFFPDQHRHVRFLLGLYINRKRRELGISTSELASQTSLTPDSIKRIEAGRKKISSEDFDKIHSSLRLEADELNEIRKIAGVSLINHFSKVLVPNYPV